MSKAVLVVNSFFKKVSVSLFSTSLSASFFLIQLQDPWSHVCLFTFAFSESSLKKGPFSPNRAPAHGRGSRSLAEKCCSRWAAGAPETPSTRWSATSRARTSGASWPQWTSGDAAWGWRCWTICCMRLAAMMGRATSIRWRGKTCLCYFVFLKDLWHIASRSMRGE